MPLPGGPADKLGNRYENMWTVLHMVDVMAERADQIRIEAPGDEGVAAEFWLQTTDGREYHQAKLRSPSRGNWTIARLISEGVLPGFLGHLRRSPDTICVFASTHPAEALAELADRARGAAAFEEFQQAFLASSREVRGEFATLCRRWAGDDAPDAPGQAEVFQLLQRLRVEVISEQFLQRTVDAQLDFLVDGDAATARALLTQLAAESIYKALTPADIWRYLEGHGLRRRQWANDPRLLPAVEAATERYLRLIESTLAGGVAIPRDESEQIAGLVRDGARRRILASGIAGCGKSGVLAQAIRRAQHDGWPVLALRVDRLTPTVLPRDVGAQLGLPGSPPQVLAAVAQDRNCLLVIDQLDAVSKVSGRNPRFLECIDEMIDQAAQHPRMRLVVACRDFDLQNDDSLRRLTARPEETERVSIGMLPHETICEVVTRAGLDAGALSEKQMRLLALPLHVALFLQVAEGGRSDLRTLGSTGELYEAYWDEKQVRLEARLGRGAAWNEVIDALCQHMSEHQELSAAEAIVDGYRRDARAMASENVITISDRRVQFFHESFFDYAFARRFAARGGRLPELLLGGEQHLFRRAQVRQILTYERDGDRARYLADLREVLVEPKVRFHIKRAVFDALAQLADPTEEEWRVLSDCLAVGDASLARGAWGVLVRSSAWFQLLDQCGVIRQWLDGTDEAQIDRMVGLLIGMQRGEPDRVARLLGPYVGLPQRWERRLQYAVAFADIGASREFLDFFLRLIDMGVLDGGSVQLAQNDGFWLRMDRTADQHPEWACEVAARYLRRRLALSLQKGEANPFDRSGGTIAPYGFADRVLSRCSSGAPLAFVRELLPFMLQVMDLTSEGDETPRADAVWEYRSVGRGFNTARQLLSAMDSALRALARESPDTLTALVEEFALDSSPFETVQFLMVRAYAANGPAFADHGVDYLCNSPARFSTGYFDGEHGRYWASRELIAETTPHCSAERLHRLEEALLRYYPGVERKARMQRYRGHAQFVLLDAIDPVRRSSAAAGRLREWQRKFETTVIGAPRPMKAYAVPSPIPPASAERMTDEQWLSAIGKYGDRESRPDWRDADGRLVGGALQLSEVLKAQAKADPGRFGRLMLSFPDDANPVYFSAVVDGLAEASPTAEQAVGVCQRAHALPGRPVGFAIAHLIEGLAGTVVPPELLDMVAWYATAHPDPDKELWRTEVPGGGVYYGGDITNAGLNSTRGRAVVTVATILFRSPDLVPQLRTALERMVADPIIAVRGWVAHALLPLLNYDRDYAVDLFLRLCETEDVLLGTRFADEFLGWATRTHFSALLPLLERMFASRDPAAADAGARHMCLAGLYIDEAQDLVERCLSGSEAQRTGAAQVLAANVERVELRGVCAAGLARLFGDPCEGVQDAAAHCFRELEGPSFGEFIDLAYQFIDSPAYRRQYADLAFALRESPTVAPDLVCAACERFLEVAGLQAGDIAQGAGFEASVFSELIFRAYATAASEPVKSRCLDVIDRLAEVAAYGIDEPLQEYDR